MWTLKQPVWMEGGMLTAEYFGCGLAFLSALRPLLGARPAPQLTVCPLVAKSETSPSQMALLVHHHPEIANTCSEGCITCSCLGPSRPENVHITGNALTLQPYASQPL